MRRLVLSQYSQNFWAKFDCFTGICISTFHLSFSFSRNFNPQSRRGTFLFSRSWSACKWIYLTCCLDFLLLLMLLKLPLLAKTSVRIILNYLFWNYEQSMVIFLHVMTFCRLIVKSCRIFDSELLKCGGCATFKVLTFF